MKQVTVNLYEFHELSQEAKDRARSDFNANDTYNWSGDAIKSIEKLAEHFGCKLMDYSFSWDWPAHWKAVFEDCDAPLDESDIAARLDELGEYDKTTLRGLGECKLTGCFTDEECIDGFREAWHGGERDLQKLLSAATRKLLIACAEDYDHQQSEEAFAETCKANEFWFREDGEME